MLPPYELISKKQSGFAHSPEELRDLIDGFIRGDIPDYQMTAWLMAVYFKGMTRRETVSLTEAMIDSGSRIRHNNLGLTAVDKHSTGGVGDKITLILAPLLAASGVAVPTVTGRGLGFTGGTLDKFESIPGFRTSLSIREFEELTLRLGLAFGAQSDELVPADRRIYALRDVTGTIRSLPLITSSILSKKIAEGIEAIVFDVKCGLGAFMETVDEAIELAHWLVEVAGLFGLKAAALVTTMDEPLGEAVGNWVEVKESIEVLRGDRKPKDLVRLTECLGGTLLYISGSAGSPEEGIEQLHRSWVNGLGLDKFMQAVEAQGGDRRLLEKAGEMQGSSDGPCNPGIVIPLFAERAGYVTKINACEVGFCAVEIGAGRKRAEDSVDPAAGILIKAKVSQRVEKDQELALVLGNNEDVCKGIIPRLTAAFEIRETPSSVPPLIRHVITSTGLHGWETFCRGEVK